MPDILEGCARALRGQGAEVLENEPMSRHTSFRIGGPARLFVPVSGTGELRNAVKLLSVSGAPYFVLGRGSNLLVSDAGYRGAVLHIGEGMGAVRLSGETSVTAEAGALLSAVCRFAADAGLSGLEFAYGIPGSVGGAAVMNAGAYGGEMAQCLAKAFYIGADGAYGELSGAGLEFGYRRSAFSRGGKIVTGAEFSLKKGDPEAIRAAMLDYSARRAGKQPLDKPSAGSVFLRPEGHYAGALIEGAGLKGFAVGGAQVSEKHAGFIVNNGGATAADVMKLIDTIKDKVFASSGVTLVCEIKTLGF